MGKQDWRRCARAAALGALAVAVSGCPRTPAVEERPAQQMTVASFTEGSPVRALEIIPPYVFSASRQGLDRWDPSTGRRLQLNAEHGLPGDRVESMAYDLARNWLWIATDSGITRYEVQSGAFSELPPPPQVLGLMPLRSVVVEPAGDGGLWLGHPRGLYYTNAAGQWAGTPINETVTTLHRMRDGWLWIGTEQGIIALRPDGESYRYGPEQGCDIERVRIITTAPGETPLVVGENEQGEQRIVALFDKRCASYRVAPDVPWLSTDRRGGDLLVLTPDHLYTLTASAPEGPKGLRRNGMRLLPVAWAEDVTAPSNPFAIASVDQIQVPHGGRIVAASAQEILLGTSSLGTARFAGNDPVSWLRRSELVDSASALTVACKTASECYVGTGSRGWRYDGATLAPVARPSGPVLAFARNPEGEVYAVMRGEDERRLFVERLGTDGSWARVSGVDMETPGIRAEVTFARFSPSGTLWVGLHYSEDLRALRPYGVAQVDVSRGEVTYHRRMRRRRRRGLRIPPTVTALAFLDDGEAWLASPEGAVQVRKRKVVIHEEKRNGLKTDVVRGIATSPGGLVFVASRAGVGSFDGESWTYPPMLRDPVNDVAVGPDGRLWMATQRGLLVYDGADVRRIDVHRGLLENQLDQVAIDDFGRVWVRGSKGISIVTP